MKREIKLKKCIVCKKEKIVKFEDSKNGEIHEYNYSCYSCLEKNKSIFYNGGKS